MARLGSAARRPLAAAVCAALWALGASAPAAAQAADPYARAEAAEERSEWAAAAAAYRDALAAEPASLVALLGLERVYDQMGARDSLLPLVARALAIQPRDATVWGIQLRTVHATGDRTRVRATYDAWRAATPGDAAADRAYVRLLLSDGDTRAADTVLREAAARAGSPRGFAYETAMLRASLGLWEGAAQAWRVTVDDRPSFTQAAGYSLLGVPAAQRDAVRRVFAAPPATVGARAVLAALELAWGEPRAGWLALRDLPPDSAAAATWREFARRAEGAEAWLVARDALTAAAAAAGEPATLAEAARDALRGGDPHGADTLAALAAARLDSAFATAVAVPVRVEALSVLGRGAEAERLAAGYAKWSAPEERTAMTRRVAWAWVRSGDLARARASLDEAGASGSEAAGWLALYDGDLATARRLLPPERASSADELAAVSLLGRTARDRSAAAGRAFLALARADSAAAAREFALAAAELPDAAPLLLALAARLDAAHGDDAAAVLLWRRVLEESPQSPEAPASELEWARALRRQRRDADAVARLEHLILTYPESALVPQARRELDLARRAVPAAS